MKVSIQKAYSVRLYLPRKTDKTATLAYLRKIAGGYTGYMDACGVWAPATKPTEVHAEPVCVYEANVLAKTQHMSKKYTGMSAGELKNHVVEMGQLFLDANPDELCFMARCVGDLITIERTKH